MPTTSTRKAIPKMADSDPMSDVAEAIRDLADRVDELLPLSGQASVSLVSASSAYTTVTFPGSYFAATPRIVATVNGDANYFAIVGTASASSVRVYAVHRAGSTVTATITVDWIAVKA